MPEHKELLKRWADHVKNNVLSETDLRLILLSHIHQSVSDNDKLSPIHYKTGDGKTALSLIYRDGSLRKITEGPSLSDTLVTQIEASINVELGSRTSEIERHVVFSYVPLKGNWRYQNLFQLSPVPRGAPLADPFATITSLVFPLLLETRFKSSAAPGLRTLRLLNARRQNVLLLGLLLRGGLRDQQNDFKWVITDNHDDLSACLQQGYLIPGFRLTKKSFRQISKKCPILPHDEYYRDDRVSTASATMSVPDSLERTLDVFFGLPLSAQERFLRACYWFQQSRVTDSQSSSFHALVQSVEVLANPEHRRDSEPTKNFIDFVEQYASGTDRKIRQDLYDTRSDISHAGYVLQGDLPFLVASPVLVKETKNHRMLRFVAQEALIDRLLDTSNPI